MNRWFLCLGVLASVGSTSAVLGASAGQGQLWTEPPPAVARVEMTPPSPGQFDPQNIGLLSRASQLAGKKVEDDFGRKLGTLEDVLVDLNSGRIAGCVVSVDGKRRLIPPEAFFPVSEDRIVFNKDRQALGSAPEYAGTYSIDALNRAYAHFGIVNRSAVNPKSAVSAKGLRGRAVTGNAGQALAHVKDVALDVSKGAVVYVMVEPRTDRGQLHVMPPHALKAGADNANLGLAVDEQRFVSGPKVPANFWTQITVPEFASSVYRHYDVSPTKPAQALTPTGRTDEAIHSAVMSEIVNSPSLAAVNARDLNISVKNGRVRLSGTVGSKSAREDLVSFASRVVGAANVEDSLTVK